MGASYTKLRSGEWGIRVDGKPATGSKVTVVRKDGSTSVETISKVVWSGNDKTFPNRIVSICAIERASSGGGEKRRPGSCGCDCGDCSPRCHCDPHCICRGGNIYDC